MADHALPSLPCPDEWTRGRPVAPPLSGDHPWPHHPRCSFSESRGLGWCDCRDSHGPSKPTRSRRYTCEDVASVRTAVAAAVSLPVEDVTEAVDELLFRLVYLRDRAAPAAADGPVSLDNTAPAGAEVIDG